MELNGFVERASALAPAYIKKHVGKDSEPDLNRLLQMINCVPVELAEEGRYELVSDPEHLVVAVAMFEIIGFVREEFGLKLEIKGPGWATISCA